MKAIQALKAALATATPDWVALSPNDSSNDGGTHIEIHDGFGRTATVYGEPEDTEVIANANLMVLARSYMTDLLEATEALSYLREKYMQMASDGDVTEAEFISEAQGILVGDVVSDLMDRIASGKAVPNTAFIKEPFLSRL